MIHPPSAGRDGSAATPGGTISFGEEVSARRPERFWLCAVVALGVFAHLWGLAAGPPLGDHEAIVAQSAREILETHEWLIPPFNGVPFIRKPPLQFWSVAAASFLLDEPGAGARVTAFTSRLPSALAAIGCMLAVYWIARWMYNPRQSLVAAAIMACGAAVMFYGHNAQTEMLLATFCALSMGFFWMGTRRPLKASLYFTLFYVALAMAMMAKAPFPLPMVGLPLFIYWFVTIPVAETWRDRRRPASVRRGLPMHLRAQFVRLPWKWVLMGLVLFLVLVLPWPLWVYRQLRQQALDLWDLEFFSRYSGELSSRSQPAWYYLLLLVPAMLPFGLSLFEAFAAPFLKMYRRERAGLLFAFTWVVVQVGFLSTSPFKRPHYMLPVIPGLALLLAPVIDRLFLQPRELKRWMVRAAVLTSCIGAAVGMGIGTAVVAHEEPYALTAMWGGGLLLTVGIGLTGGLFLKRHRAASLAVLCVTSALTFGWAWDIVGQSELGREIIELSDWLRDEIEPEHRDEIIWAVGRQDARVPFYAGFPVKALFTDLALAQKRENRLTVPEELLREGAEKITTRLHSNEVVYYIIDAEALVRLRSYLKLRCIELFRVSPKPDDRDKDLVVITNAWNTAAVPDASRPGQ